MGDPIIDNATVRSGMQKAYNESFSPDGKQVYEQGGWITKSKDGSYSIQRWPTGSSGSIRIPSSTPPNAVADFHTHPYAPDEIFFHGPSDGIPSDYFAASTRTYGLSHYIVDREGIMKYYPSSRDQSTGSFDDVGR